MDSNLGDGPPDKPSAQLSFRLDPEDASEEVPSTEGQVTERLFRIRTGSVPDLAQHAASPHFIEVLRQGAGEKRSEPDLTSPDQVQWRSAGGSKKKASKDISSNPFVPRALVPRTPPPATRAITTAIENPLRRRATRADLEEILKIATDLETFVVQVKNTEKNIKRLATELLSQLRGFARELAECGFEHPRPPFPRSILANARRHHHPANADRRT